MATRIWVISPSHWLKSMYMYMYLYIDSMYVSLIPELVCGASPENIALWFSLVFSKTWWLHVYEAEFSAGKFTIHLHSQWVGIHVMAKRVSKPFKTPTFGLCTQRKSFFFSLQDMKMKKNRLGVRSIRSSVVYLTSHHLG